jgi:putative membrane protein
MASATHFEIPASGENHFAWLRTRMAAERTFMAWLRTAASMIGFGFSIVQFFAKFTEIEDVGAPIQPHAPRMLGLMLIAAGVIGLALALHQFLIVTRHLDSAEFSAIRGQPRRSPTVLVAVALLVIGVFAFASILLRVH